jgi:hypothetical protein
MMADEFALTPPEPAPYKQPKTGRMDLLAVVAKTSLELGAFELWGVSNHFTREGIASWLDSNRTGPVGNFVGMYGWIDFHAVWGDKEVPWATEEGRAAFE